VDSIKCKYDNSKADKKGEICAAKEYLCQHFQSYGLPSSFTWLLVCSLQEGHFWKGNDSFFLGAGQPGLAAHWYCDRLSKPLTKYMEKVEFIRPGHANMHGIGKMGCYI
jgi:hypothetical protein